MPGQPPSIASYLSRRLQERAQELTRAWLVRVLERIDANPTRVFPTRSLENHIPALIQKLAASLTREPAPLDADFVRKELELLASLRRGQGYDQDELLQEFDLLQDILFRAAHEAAEEYGREFAVKVPAHEAMAVAVRLARLQREMGETTARWFERDAKLHTAEREALLADFGRAVTHELRNRLSTAVSTLHVLRGSETPLSPHAQGLLESLESSLRQTEDVVSDVTAVALGHSAETAARRIQPLDVIAERTLREFRDFAAERGVELFLEKPFPDFLVDAPRVQLVLVNLVSNAVKYSDRTKPERWVRVSAQETDDDGWWRVDVSDNGVGIDRHEQARIFDDSVRGSDQEEGQGYGLFLARTVVGQLRGRIWAEGEAGKGTTVSFTLSTPDQELPSSP